MWFRSKILYFVFGCISIVVCVFAGCGEDDENGTPEASIPTDGLITYYPFNGNANDASGNGNDGVVHGATLTEDRFGNPNIVRIVLMEKVTISIFGLLRKSIQKLIHMRDQYVFGYYLLKRKVLFLNFFRVIKIDYISRR